MSGRRCVSCGAPVGTLADRCPRCGADPDIALIELGAGDDQARPGWTRPSGRGRSWLPLVGAAIAVWAVVALLGAVRGDSSGEEGGDSSIDEDRTKNEPDETTTTPTSASSRPTAVAGVSVEGSLGEATGLHVVATRSGRLIDVDLDTGTAVEHDISGVVVDANRFGVLVVDDGALVWRPFPLGSAAPVTVAPYEDGLDYGWLLEDGSGFWHGEGTDDHVPAARTLQLLALDGSGVIATVPLPIEAHPIGVSDDLLVVTAAGRVYRVNPRGAVTDLGSGAAFAAGNGYVVVSRCDEQLRCETVRIHLASGAAELLPGLQEAIARGLGVASIAPSGSVIYATYGPEGRLFLAGPTGATPLLGPEQTGFDFTAPGSFSLDGEWLCLGVGGGIWVGPTAGGDGVFTRLPGGAGDRALLLDRPAW